MISAFLAHHAGITIPVPGRRSAPRSQGVRFRGQRPRRGGVDDKLNLVMLLEEGGGHLRGDRALRRAARTISALLLPPGHEDDAARLEDRLHPHGDRAPGRILLPAEILGGVPPREGVEVDQARAGPAGAPGLVEPDVPRPADPEDPEVSIPPAARILSS